MGFFPEWMSHPLDSLGNAFADGLGWIGGKLATGAAKKVGIDIGDDKPASAPAPAGAATGTPVPAASAAAGAPPVGDPTAFTGKDAPPEKEQNTLQKMMSGLFGGGKDGKDGEGMIGGMLKAAKGKGGLLMAAVAGVAVFATGGGAMMAIIAMLAALLFGDKLIDLASSVIGSFSKPMGSGDRTQAQGGNSPSQEAGKSQQKAAEPGIVDRVEKMASDTVTTVVDTTDHLYNRAKVYAKTALNSDEKLKAIDVVEFFKDKGWTQEQAIGIAANLKQESEFRTGAVGDGGRSHGIAQWNGKRLKAYEELYGHKINDPSIPEGQKKYEQLNFIDHELRTTEKAAGTALAQAKTHDEAARIFSNLFERPADKVNEPTRRAGIAEGIHTAMQESGRTNGTQVASTGTPVPARTHPAPAAAAATVVASLSTDEVAARDAAEAIRNAQASSKARLAMTTAETSTVVTQNNLPTAGGTSGGGRGTQVASS